MPIVPTRIIGIIGAARGAIRFAGVMPPIGIVPVGIIGIKVKLESISAFKDAHTLSRCGRQSISSHQIHNNPRRTSKSVINVRGHCQCHHLLQLGYSVAITDEIRSDPEQESSGTNQKSALDMHVSRGRKVRISLP